MLTSILDTPLILSFYESLLSFLQQLCQTKSGANHVLKAGLFQAVRDSHLFAADPDLGIGKYAWIDRDRLSNRRRH